jgi:hypothetical protein
VRAPSKLLSLLLPVIVAPACDAQTGKAAPTEPAGPSRGTIHIGSVGITPHYEMTASVPEECSVPGAAGPDEGLTKLGVEVTLSARGAVQVPANPYYALLIDSERRVFEATLGGCEPALEPRLLEPGESARGLVVFDVPERSRGLELVYAPRLSFSADRAEPGELPNDIVDELVFSLGH